MNPVSGHQGLTTQITPTAGPCAIRIFAARTYIIRIALAFLPESAFLPKQQEEKQAGPWHGFGHFASPLARKQPGRSGTAVQCDLQEGCRVVALPGGCEVPPERHRAWY
ncbi:unnamed protein product [Fusarium graminearum]|nr:unnamed protein product [Fusarium graminearum]